MAACICVHAACSVLVYGMDTNICRMGIKRNKNSKFIDSVCYALKMGVTLHLSLTRIDFTSVYLNIELLD